MSKKNILFVVNNLSGTVSQYNIPKCIEMFLDKDKYEAKTFFIDHEYEEEKYLNRLNEDWDAIISVGGDGTLLELGQKIMDRNITIGIIPIGSGNGMATHLGYKPRAIEQAFQIINQGKIKAVDIGKINDGYFFSNFGIGIDAVVAKDFKIKKKRSFLTYSFLTIKRLLGIQPTMIRYKSHNEEKTVETYIFNVFNSNLYGYNVGLLPWASAFDGKLDVVYLPKVSLPKMIWAGIAIFAKRPNLSKDLHYFEAEAITLFNSEKVNYQVDGDPKSTNGDIEIGVLKGKLNFIVP